MQTLQPQSQKLRSRRESLGFTQLELATLAGVSERTIRNVEKGLPIGRALLSCIAESLGVLIPDVAVASALADKATRWTKNSQTLSLCIDHPILRRDRRTFTRQVQEDIDVHNLGIIAGVNLEELAEGVYSGPSEFEAFRESTVKFWSSDRNGAAWTEAPVGDADTMLVRGFHELKQEDGGVTWGKFQFVADFEGERIRSVIVTVVPSPPPKLQSGTSQA